MSKFKTASSEGRPVIGRLGEDERVVGKGKTALEIWQLQALVQSMAHACAVSYRVGDLFPPRGH